ncbi:hypothetical protein SAMN06265365_110103 [Tistlia consotensis]|uniref:Uncharacterized protein n=1 Tax=Tistlia consotensis USBA 355 TaxID=560819 RepID=A0A1Y6BSI9_9PROT|nr:hypothetical protein [Tistlia consotensis]SMF27077.1 hypothetical protein SAMN05428998_10953 [Tistlia consotensis USBA 355]SNR66539.1 hypothetical protein SAMN06265365_110103 [Tistlia consotensis]
MQSYLFAGAFAVAAAVGAVYLGSVEPRLAQQQVSPERAAARTEAQLMIVRQGQARDLYREQPDLTGRIDPAELPPTGRAFSSAVLADGRLVTWRSDVAADDRGWLLSVLAVEAPGRGGRVSRGELVSGSTSIGAAAIPGGGSLPEGAIFLADRPTEATAPSVEPLEVEAPWRWEACPAGTYGRGRQIDRASGALVADYCRAARVTREGQTIDCPIGQAGQGRRVRQVITAGLDRTYGEWQDDFSLCFDLSRPAIRAVSVPTPYVMGEGQEGASCPGLSGLALVSGGYSRTRQQATLASGQLVAGPWNPWGGSCRYRESQSQACSAPGGYSQVDGSGFTRTRTADRDVGGNVSYAGWGAWSGSCRYRQTDQASCSPPGGYSTYQGSGYSRWRDLYETSPGSYSDSGWSGWSGSCRYYRDEAASCESGYEGSKTYRRYYGQASPGGGLSYQTQDLIANDCHQVQTETRVVCLPDNWNTGDGSWPPPGTVGCTTEGSSNGQICTLWKICSAAEKEQYGSNDAGPNTDGNGAGSGDNGGAGAGN